MPGAPYRQYRTCKRDTPRAGWHSMHVCNKTVYLF